jgi:hypothetical protein
MQNYKGQRENFTGTVGAQGPAKGVMEIVDIIELFFIKELIDTIVRETNRYTEQFIRGHELSIRSPARAWKTVTGRNLYCIGVVHAYGHYPETYSDVIVYHQRVISTPEFRDIMTREVGNNM